MRQQIALDTKEREHIDTLRNNERNAAMTEFESWKKQQKSSCKITEITEETEVGKYKSVFSAHCWYT